MSNMNEDNDNSIVESEQIEARDLLMRTEEAKRNALIAYILMALGYFTGITWIIGFVWALVKKSEAKGTKYIDHYDNMISLFWWSLGLSILGFLLVFVFVGFIILGAVWIWTVYKLVKGIANLTSDMPYNYKR